MRNIELRASLAYPCRQWHDAGMKAADLHIHTCYSHGHNSPWEMYVAAENNGVSLMGFSEHSPRPDGYDYTHEYRKRLADHFLDYINNVQSLKALAAKQGGCQVLLGLEMDWLPDEIDFIKRAANAFPYDYLIGSVHFLDHWGFDDSQDPWNAADYDQRARWYAQYFSIWKSMLESGLFHIAAHPDLIKIFSVDSFHEWVEQPSSQRLIKAGLVALKSAGMAMEISSAGLRKPCREIYPGPVIMKLASELGVRITLASDAHNAGDVAFHFDHLVDYARSYSFDRASFLINGRVMEMPF